MTNADATAALQVVIAEIAIAMLAKKDSVTLAAIAKAATRKSGEEVSSADVAGALRALSGFDVAGGKVSQ